MRKVKEKMQAEQEEERRGESASRKMKRRTKEIKQ